MNRGPREVKRNRYRGLSVALHTQRGLLFVQSVGIIVSLAMSAVSLILSLMLSASTLHEQNVRTSADLMLKFDDDFDKGKNPGMLDAIEDGRPVLKENGGHFTEADLDDLLGVYELIADARAHNLLYDDMIYDAFSFDLESVYGNKEVQSYVAGCRRQDSSLYTGFVSLAKTFSRQKGGRPK